MRSAAPTMFTRLRVNLYSLLIQFFGYADYMWLHIRGVGEWTNRLYDYFEKEQEKLHNLNENLPIANPQAITVTPNGSVKLANDDEDLKLLKA